MPRGMLTPRPRLEPRWPGSPARRQVGERDEPTARLRERGTNDDRHLGTACEGRVMGAIARRVGGLALALVIPLAGACMHGAGKPADTRQAAPSPDSATVALWRFDEPAGVRCGDAGPFRVEATAGPGTNGSLRGLGGARRVTPVIHSLGDGPR